MSSSGLPPPVERAAINRPSGHRYAFVTKAYLSVPAPATPRPRRGRRRRRLPLDVGTVPTPSLQAKERNGPSWAARSHRRMLIALPTTPPDSLIGVANRAARRSPRATDGDYRFLVLRAAELMRILDSR